MDITFRCPTCQTALTMHPEPTADNRSVRCVDCGTETPFTPSSSLINNNMVDECPRCHKSAFYVQRDFNQRVGLAVMVLFAFIGLIFVYLRRPMLFYACLGVGAMIDLVLHRMLPDITICYACKTAFRDVSPNPDHAPFDLHIADVYDNRAKG